MISLLSENNSQSYSISLRHVTVFRTQPLRFVFRAPMGNRALIRKKRKSPCYTLLFGLHGDAFIKENTHEFSLFPHSLLLIPANTSFAVSTEEHANVSFLAVEFELLPTEFNFDLTKHGIFYLENAKTFAPFFEDIQNLTEHQHAYGEALLISLFEKIRTSNLSKNDPRFLYQHAVAYIRRHFADPPTSTLIAFGTHYTSDHLTKLLKAAHGISLSELIKRERLEILKNYLRFTSFSVERIAKILAFSSPAAMVNFFKYHVDITPNEYRKNNERTTK